MRERESVSLRISITEENLVSATTATWARVSLRKKDCRGALKRVLLCQMICSTQTHFTLSSLVSADHLATQDLPPPPLLISCIFNGSNKGRNWRVKRSKWRMRVSKQGRLADILTKRAELWLRRWKLDTSNRYSKDWTMTMMGWFQLKESI